MKNKYFVLLSYIIYFLINIASASESNSSFRNPYRFIENKGQLRDYSGNEVPYVKFYIQLTGVNIYLTTSGPVYEFIKYKKDIGSYSKESLNMQMIPYNKASSNKSEILYIPENSYRMDMIFSGANPNTMISGQNENGGYNNYYIGNDISKWVKEAKLFKQVLYKNLYPGIDAIFYIKENGDGIKYDLIIHPGADLEQINIQYTSADSVSINKTGDIIIKTPLGNIIEESPYSYQICHDLKKEIKCSFYKNGQYISFFAENYDKTKQLILDPSILVWSTYYGGTGLGEEAWNINTDASGNVLVVGQTYGNDFPIQNSWQANFNGGNSDCFVLKFSNSGTRLWATYYGGNKYEQGWWLDTDTNNNVFVTGHTFGTTSSSCWPPYNTGDPNSFPTLNPGSGAYFKNTFTKGSGNIADIFILKFDPNGTLLWGTLYGDSLLDNSFCINVDKNEDIIIAGSSASLYNIATPGAFQTNNAGPFGVSTSGDIIIVKFNNNGVLKWGTYYGGIHGESAYSVGTDKNNDIIISGYNYNGEFPVYNASQSLYGGGSHDAIIMKFKSDGSGPLWSTYFGGTTIDAANSLSIDTAGNIIVPGYTSGNLPVTSGTFQQTFGGGTYDAFISKWTNSGLLLWATYCGGSNDEIAYESVVDSKGYAYVSGQTSSSNFPSTPFSYQPLYGGGYQDGFITEVNGDYGTLICSSFFGGSNNDYSFGITTDDSDNIFITGATNSTAAQGFPVTPGAFQLIKSDELDPFIAKLTNLPNIPDASFTASIQSGCDTSIVNFTNTSLSKNTCSSNTTYQWIFEGGVPSNSSSQSPTNISYAYPGSFHAKLIVTNIAGIDSSEIIINIPENDLDVSITTNKGLCGTNPDSATANPTGGKSPYSYKWNTLPEQTTKTASNLTLGTYTVTITDDNGCTASEDILIINNNPVNAGGDTSINICKYESPFNMIDSLSNTPDTGGKWFSPLNVLLENSMFYPAGMTGGTYMYVITGNGICPNDTAYLTIINSDSPIIEVSTDTSIFRGDTAFLHTTQNSNYSYFWTDKLTFNSNLSSISINPQNTTIFYLSVTDLTTLCSNSDSVKITVTFIPIIVYNTITPNGDNVNDTWTISNIDYYKDNTVKIYNRLGMLVYSATNYKNNWNGTYKNKPLMGGTYYYIIDLNNESELYKGYLTIIR